MLRLYNHPISKDDLIKTAGYLLGCYNINLYDIQVLIDLLDQERGYKAHKREHGDQLFDAMPWFRSVTKTLLSEATGPEKLQEAFGDDLAAAFLFTLLIRCEEDGADMDFKAADLLMLEDMGYFQQCGEDVAVKITAKLRGIFDLLAKLTGEVTIDGKPVDSKQLQRMVSEL